MVRCVCSCKAQACVGPHTHARAPSFPMHHASPPFLHIHTHTHATGQGIKRFYQQKRDSEWDGWVEVRVALNEQKVRQCQCRKRSSIVCVCLFGEHVTKTDDTNIAPNKPTAHPSNTGQGVRLLGRRRRLPAPGLRAHRPRQKHHARRPERAGARCVRIGLRAL